MKRFFRPIFVRDHGRFTQVDGLRALAILWTFSFHVVLLFANVVPTSEALRLFGQPALQALMHGHFGVDIFFVISGFLIGDLLIRELEKTGTVDLRSFFIRRLVRLAPVYYLLVAVLLALGCLTADPAMNIANAWTNVCYVNNFIPELQQFMPWTWSLAVEEQFYLLCPLLILMMFRKNMNPFWLLSLLIGAGFALNVALAKTSGEPFHFVIHPALADDIGDCSRYLDLLYTKLDARYAALLLGVVLAYGVRSPALMKAIAPGSVAAALGAAGLAIITAVLMNLDYTTPQAPVGTVFLATHRYWFAVGMALVLLVTFSDSGIGRMLHRFLSLRCWYPLAQLSYPAYLLHPVVILGLMRGWYRGQPITLMDVAQLGVMSALITAGISLLLSAFVERPLMAMRPQTVARVNPDHPELPTAKPRDRAARAAQPA